MEERQSGGVVSARMKQEGRQWNSLVSQMTCTGKHFFIITYLPHSPCPLPLSLNSPAPYLLKWPTGSFQGSPLGALFYINCYIEGRNGGKRARLYFFFFLRGFLSFLCFFH